MSNVAHKSNSVERERERERALTNYNFLKRVVSYTYADARA